MRSELYDLFFGSFGNETKILSWRYVYKFGETQKFYDIPLRFGSTIILSTQRIARIVDSIPSIIGINRNLDKKKLILFLVLTR